MAATLSKLGVHHYLPLKSELRKWSDRKQIVETPLFSGYLFVHINLSTNSRLQVLKAPGVGALVGNQMGPLPIPDRQIEDIRRLITVGVECSVQPLLKEGDRVRVVRGALAGIEGTLIRNSSASRLLVSIEMIRQSLSVSILRSDVELVAPNRSLKCAPIRSHRLQIDFAEANRIAEHVARKSSRKSRGTSLQLNATSHSSN